MFFWLEWLVLIIWAALGGVMGYYRLQYLEFPLFFIVLLISTALALAAVAWIRGRRRHADG